MRNSRKAFCEPSHVTLNDTRLMDPSTRLGFEDTRHRRHGYRRALLSTFTFPVASNSSNASSLVLSSMKCFMKLVCFHACCDVGP